MVKLEFAELGRVFAKIYIKPLNKYIKKPVDFKVDTGADTSTISKIDLLGLGYDLDWIRNNAIVFEEKDRPTTASGEKVNAGYVQLPLINVLGYEGTNWPFQVILDEDRDFRNLLGRDLLTGFNYSFDNDNKTFSIERAKAFEPLYTFLPGQEIHEVVTNP